MHFCMQNCFTFEKAYSLTGYPCSQYKRQKYCPTSEAGSKTAHLPNSGLALYLFCHIKLCQCYVHTGQEFRGLFISTSEPTTSEGETRDSTKSISDPAVFITAITRARSLIVATGNPFMLLRREEHMVKKYGERGHCWSLFLKACIDNGTLSVYCECESSSTTLTLLEGEINKRVSHLRVPELRKGNLVFKLF